MLHETKFVNLFQPRGPDLQQNIGMVKLKELIEGKKLLKRFPGLRLRVLLLNKSSAHLCVYVDASYASNDELSSQLGYLLLPCDENNKAHFVGF